MAYASALLDWIAFVDRYCINMFSIIKNEIAEQLKRNLNNKVKNRGLSFYFFKVVYVFSTGLLLVLIVR